MGVLLFQSNKNSVGGRIDKAMEIIRLTGKQTRVGAWSFIPLSRRRFLRGRSDKQPAISLRNFGAFIRALG
jgi:hypothetical protein